MFFCFVQLLFSKGLSFVPIRGTGEALQAAKCLGKLYSRQGPWAVCEGANKVAGKSGLPVGEAWCFSLNKWENGTTERRRTMCLKRSFPFLIHFAVGMWIRNSTTYCCILRKVSALSSLWQHFLHDVTSCLMLMSLLTFNNMMQPMANSHMSQGNHGPEKFGNHSIKPNIY